jgi:hypothetical protein
MASIKQPLLQKIRHPFILKRWYELFGARRMRNLTPKTACFWILGEGHRSVPPVCVSVQWAGCVEVGQLHTGQDGDASFFCGSKSNFKETMV